MDEDLYYNGYNVTICISGVNSPVILNRTSARDKSTLTLLRCLHLFPITKQVLTTYANDYQSRVMFTLKVLMHDKLGVSSRTISLGYGTLEIQLQ